MKILILGMDGYIGWSLALHLATKGNIVTGIDNFSRRKNVEEVGSWSATPIQDMKDRMTVVKRSLDGRLMFYEGDLQDYEFTADVIKACEPDAIVHLGELPAAPYSMIDVQHATYTQQNNVIGTLNVLFAMRDYAPQAHLVKLGTMGEYGTPGVDIPEGFFDLEQNGNKVRLMFPRAPGSFYHASKVHDTYNVWLACNVFGLRSTDIMQGVVYGTRTEEINPSEETRISTRFDFDEIFGTVINRYCAEAVIGHPLTVYGRGGQTRGFLALIDSIQCLTLICENPPEKGEYRVINQIDEIYSVGDLAIRVYRAATELGLSTEILNIPNPRKEAEEHYYKVEARHLRRLGFKRTRSLNEEVKLILTDLIRFKDRIKVKEQTINPKTRWVSCKEILAPNPSQRRFD